MIPAWKLNAAIMNVNKLGGHSGTLEEMVREPAFSKVLRIPHTVDFFYDKEVELIIPSDERAEDWLKNGLKMGAWDTCLVRSEIPDQRTAISVDPAVMATQGYRMLRLDIIRTYDLLVSFEYAEDAIEFKLRCL